MDDQPPLEAEIAAVVDLFYDRVRADPMLGPVFNGSVKDWPHHLDRLKAFWSSVMLTSGRYKGDPVAASAACGCDGASGLHAMAGPLEGYHQRTSGS